MPNLLREFLPQANVDICYPADPGANLPDSGGLECYDGVVITGSALHVYDRGPHIDPQIELARAVFDSSTPLFGSCWGLQVITTAAGGSVRRNPKGREIGFGRRIRLTASGRGHPIFAGKDEVFDAVTIHLDEVETLAPNMQVLALNAFSAVQAAEVKVNGCTAWGVQYHPEYSLADIAASFRRHGKRLIEEKFFNDVDELHDYAETVAVLHDEADTTSRGPGGSASIQPCWTRTSGPAKSATGSIIRCCRPAASAAGSNVWIFGTVMWLSPAGPEPSGPRWLGALLEHGAICHIPTHGERSHRRFSPTRNMNA